MVTRRGFIGAIVGVSLSLFARWPKAPRRLYWAGGSGRWEDAANWSREPRGWGGAGVPNDKTDVVINVRRGEKIEITSGGQCNCNRLAFEGEGTIEWNADVYANCWLA